MQIFLQHIRDCSFTIRLRVGWKYFFEVFLIICICVISSGSLKAQYVVDSWTTRHGLPSNIMNDLIQSEVGYLWLATDNGLTRFDGASFTLFNSSNTPGLVSNKTARIFEDSRGRLWIGTVADQMTLIEQDSSIHLGEEYGLGTDEITAIGEDEEGTLWVGTLSGLSWWDEERRLFHPFRGRQTASSISQLYPGDAVFRPYHEQAVLQFYKDDEGTLWVISPHRIWPLTKECREEASQCMDMAKLASGGAVSVNPFLPAADFSSAPGTQADLETGQQEKETELLIDMTDGPEDVPYFRSMAISANGTRWIGTMNGVIRLASGEVTTFTEQNLSHGTVTQLLIDSEQRVWIGTQRGLQVIQSGGTAPTLRRLPEFANESITGIQEDHEQSIWVGTAASGLKQIKSTPFRVIGQPEGLTSDLILPVHEDREGNLWIGTNCFGINRLAPVYGSLLNSVSNSTESDHLSPILNATDNGITRYWKDTGWRNACVWTLRATSDGTLWIGEWGGGLSMMRPGEEIAPAPFRHLLSSDVILALYEDREGGLWIGTRGAGAYRWFGDELTHFGTDDGLSHSFVNYILQTKDGAMWFGTHNGVTRYHEGNSRQFTREDGISHPQVRALFEPFPGVVWSGTYGGGLNQIRLPDDGSVAIQTLDTQQGLFDDIVSQIVEDDEGRIWMGGKKGLFHLPKQMLADYFDGKRIGVEGTNYGFEEGMRTSEISSGFQPSLVKTRQGTLIFPTVNGVVVADPSNVSKNQIPPRVAIEQVQAGEVVLQAGSGVQLSAGINDLEITYTALSFRNPDKIEFEYRLKGFEESWRSAGNRRTAFFTNVPPGEYSFQVRASNNDGVWNKKGAVISVSIAPFFFQTQWFMGLCVFVLAGFIAAGYKLRIRQMKRREKILKNTVKQQTATLEKQNRKLKEMDQVKSRFFANLSHEFRTPLTLIVGPINKLLREKNYQNIEHDLSLMQRNGIRLQRLIDQILDLVKLESKSLKLDLQKFNLKEFVYKVVDLFRPLASQQALTLVIKECRDSQENRENDDFIAVVDKDKVEHILANLLSNAIKFTDEGGQITVDLRRTPNRVLVSVTDTGKGISEENQKLIFDRFYQVEEEDNRPAEGMGIGLALCKELMLLHHGDILVESEQGKGSTFTLEFLTGTEHFGESVQNLTPVTRDKTAVDVDLNLISKENGTSENKSLEEDSVVSNHDQTTLLIVEDHLDMREYLKSILAEDYKILESTNGEEALEVIEKNPPDLIIADIMMPVMDGLTFSRHLRKNSLHKNIPILFLTAQAGDENEIKALKEGGDSYLQKPFNSDLLKTRIISLLSLQQRLREQLLSDALVNKDTGNASPKDNDGESQKEREHFQSGDWTSELIRHMQSKLSDPNFGVDQFAELMHVSRSQLHRKTKKNTGRTPVQLLRETRLKKARQLIEDGVTNYSEIAYACGFNSLSYFSRSYKKQFGFAPSDTSSIQNESET